MKKIYLTIVSATLLLAGCTQDFNEPTPNIPTPDDAIAINIGGSIDQVPTTRVNDEGFCDGDGVGIYVVNYDGDTPGIMLSEGNQADNVHYVYNESENKWIPDYPIYYYDKVTPVDIIGYYPYVSNIDNVNAYSFEVAKDQSTDAANGLMGGYEASDFLWGKAEKISPTASRVNVTFHHKMAGVQIYLTEGTGWGENEWNAVDKQVLVTNTIRKATINLSNGDITPVGDIPTTGTVPAVNDGGWRAVVVPQTVEASMALLNITVDGTSYIYRKNSAFEYVAGKLHKFTIEVSKKSESGLEFKLVGEDITPWESETITHDGTAREYVVINVPAASTEENVSALKAAIEASGKDYTKIKNLKVTGEVNAFDFYFMRDEMTRLCNVNLEDVTIADTSQYYINGYSDREENCLPICAFQNKNTLIRVVLPNSITKLGERVFRDCYNLLSVGCIPDNVTHIGDQAFWGCNELQTMNIPQKLEYLGSGAFIDCFKLQWNSLPLPNTLREIGSYVFMRQGGGQVPKFNKCSLTLPDNLEKLGEGSFRGCEFVGNLIIPNKITEIPKDCFCGNNFTGTLTIPKGMISIGVSAFENNYFTGELIIPDEVISIKERAFLTAGFSGQLILPETLVELGPNAFAGNGFQGTIEIPSEISIVKNGLFGGCHKITKVILHSGILEIEYGAFNCNQLKTVVCKAKNPPVYSIGGWYGNEHPFASVYPISIEVPEESLLKYQQAEGWKDWIPSVYRDFNIDNECINALNSSFSKKTIIRAPSEMSWSIIHKPDWVTVTPSEGSGKVEVTITFDELVRGCGNRVDSLVFKPTAYDYQKVINLNQYDYEYGDGDVITNQTAIQGNGVNVVFMGDCFDAKDIAEGYYQEIMNEAITYLFAIEPYTTYKDYFNVYTVIGHSPDSGLPTTYSINQESKFSSQYAYGDRGFQFKFDDGKCFEYACKVPNITKENLNQTVIVLIENSNVYGGVTKMWYDNSAIAVCSIMRNNFPNDFRGVVQHEVGGHAFGKLVDEYINHGDFIDMCTCLCCQHNPHLEEIQSYGWGQNVSIKPNIYEVPWSHMIFDSQFQTYVDMYEGGYFHQRGVFRSEPNSCMNNNVPYFSAISREQIVKRIMEYAGEEYTFEKFKSKDNSSMGPIEFTRSMIIPESTSNYLHNKPEIMGEKPVLNF